MKNSLIGLLAIVIAIGSVAFTNHITKRNVPCPGMNPPSVHWFHIDDNVSVSCTNATISDLEAADLPRADGAGDTDPFDASPDMTASVNDPYGCDGGNVEACALGYQSTTASDYEVIDIDPTSGTDYRWRPKSTTTRTCCVTRS